jgi:enterochelin esterase-like enzyme
MMRLRVLLVLLVLPGLAACATPPSLAAGETPSARTPVPTWTLVPTRTPETPAPTPTRAPIAEALFTPTAVPAPCTETQGSVTQISVPSPTLRYPIDARLYLPPCYAASPEARYPVLYLIHGLNFKEDQWDRLGAPLAADKLSAAGEIVPLIIVMPRDRLDDRLDKAFVADLVPYIDETYRTLAAREFRAIGGLSRGGAWAIHIGLHHPGTFGRLGAHSPAVFFGDENDIVQWTWHLPTDKTLAVYVDIGEGDSLVHSAAWFDQVLTYSGVKHTYLLQSGAHNEKYWSAHVEDYLRFYASDWRDARLPSLTPNAVDQPAP